MEPTHLKQGWAGELRGARLSVPHGPCRRRRGDSARRFHSFVSFCLPPRALYRHARFPDTELPTYYKRCSYPRESVKETAFERLVILKRIAGDKAFSKQELLSRPCLP